MEFCSFISTTHQKALLSSQHADGTLSIPEPGETHQLPGREDPDISLKGSSTSAYGKITNTCPEALNLDPLTIQTMWQNILPEQK